MRPLPDHYVSTIRTTLRFAMLMVVLALLLGLVYREATKKLGYDEAAPGLYLESTLQFALVHGHAFLLLVIVPMTMVGALVLAWKVGGGEVKRRATTLFVRAYLPSATIAVAMMLYKSYAIALGVRGGSTDLAALDAGLYGGSVAFRYVLYGLVHVVLSLALAHLAIGLWRSLGKKRRAE